MFLQDALYRISVGYCGHNAVKFLQPVSAMGWK